MSNCDCTLVIAGPGSGKTTSMVGEIINSLPYLTSSRFMAVITYTNAATEKIRARLGEHARIPDNVFIGTIHSFLNRFILAPYGKIFGVLPDDYFIVEDINFSFLDGRTFRDENARRITEKDIEKKLLCKGIVTYKQIEIRARELLDENKETVRKVLGNRLQFLFIDEIQDATTGQYNIFDNLRKQKQTQIYCIGDPEQYIYGFTYKDKNMKAPSFAKIPIRRLEETKAVLKKPFAQEEENKRSTAIIVSFLNNFRQQKYRQKAVSKYANELDVVFINLTRIDEITTKFNVLCETLLPETIKKEADYCKFFLARDNDTYNVVFPAQSMIKISNDNASPKSVLSLALDYICAVTGKSKTEILLETQKSILDIRIIGIRLMHKIRENPLVNENDLQNYLKSVIPIQFRMENQKTNELFKNLILSFQTLGSSINKNSSIHKAKGLEASAVLALAENKNRLTKWLEIDYLKRENDKKDESRLGFVAFSRAKDFLCIACLEPINIPIQNKLINLGVKIIS